MNALMIAHVASMIDHFNMPNIKLLIELGYSVHVACNFKSGSSCDDAEIESLKAKLDSLGVTYTHIDFERSPFSFKNLTAYKQLKNVFNENHYDLVHCHTPMGGVLGRLAAKKYRKSGTKVIYTAHGFHFFKGAPLKNWLLYYPVEWFCAFWTDELITINKEDYARAQRHMHAKHVTYIPGVGVDLKKFSPITKGKDDNAVKRSLGMNKSDKLILSVGELNVNKNHEAVIRAVAEIKDTTIHYAIAGTGDLYDYLMNLANKLGILERVHLLGYRSDIADLYKAADLYIHPSLREGLSVALMEAIASKTVVICSNIRGNTDIVCENALFDPKNVNQIVKKIEQYITSGNIIEAEKNYINLKKFDLENVAEEMKNLYSERGGVTYLEKLYLSQQLRKSIGVPVDSMLILSVGELNKNKNHEVVIRALAKIKDTTIHYVIAGTGELNNYLENLAMGLGVSERVHLLGYRTDIAELYRASDVCILPSIREGLGLAALEGMAIGLPLICSDNRGTRDYASCGKNALVCNYNSVKQFAEAIQKMLTELDMRLKMGRINYEIAKQYDVNKVESNMMSIYENR